MLGIHVSGVAVPVRSGSIKPKVIGSPEGMTYAREHFKTYGVGFQEAIGKSYEKNSVDQQMFVHD